ncbi:PREDICTED: uncharacterized protein LOC108548795 [Eufriesea mexicana]|uniref:uncharacterized protein LOC108548795 n=1 Tax=Eufriesea mexicana TaxID=516756 RepID=UPI00083C4D62|nr:PREDICTED: uncharacterized protein LOC108548795 [Eufriesea mexicana]
MEVLLWVDVRLMKTIKLKIRFLGLFEKDEWFEVWIDSVQTNLVCHYLLLLVCVSHASESTFEEIDALPETNEYQEAPAIGTAVQTYRHPRMYRRGYHEDHGSMYQDDHDNHQDDHDHMKDEEQGMKAMGTGKVDYWGGYYDFLINEGSYKFWAVFQLATAALLIYSGFAALYYAKVNPPATDDEFDDILRRRRKRRALSIFPRDRAFCGLDSATFQRIIDAVATEIH